MPKARLNTTAVEARIQSDSPRGRAKFGAVLVPGSDTVIRAGTPIGLLLALTYASTFTASTAATFKGISPYARIRTGD